MNYKPAAMKPQPHLLGDAMLQRFIVDGHITVKPTLPHTYHSALKSQLDTLIKKNGNPGNELLPHVSELAELFADPAVDGALTSLLGPDYIMHPHRHCHDWNPDSQAQTWHKDYPITGHPRCHRGRWLLLFYYPQTITQQMGPTAIQPGTQYYIDATPDAPGLALCVEVGTVVIAHYDIWHRATANTSNRTRYMLKFLCARRAEPSVPSWNTRDAAWAPDGIHRTLWQAMWHWYRGDERPALAEATPRKIAAWIHQLDATAPATRRLAADALGTLQAAGAVPALTALLEDADEPVRLNAAYALGAQGAIAELADALVRETRHRSQANLERGDFTSPSQLDATYGLAAAGPIAVAALEKALADEAWPLRAAAATALGYMGRSAAPALPALTAALNDANEWGRRHAAEAIGYIGPEEETSIQALVTALNDRRPVTRWSLSSDPLRETATAALARMAHLAPAAEQALATFLDDESEYVRAWAATGLEPILNAPAATRAARADSQGAAHGY